jgi:hypothetical protein
VAEAEARHESDRARVARLDVGLDAVQPVVAEGESQHLGEAGAHVAAARVRLEGVVAEVARLEDVAHDLADVDHAGQLARLGHDEVAELLSFAAAAQVGLVPGRRRGRRREQPVQRAAAAHRGEELLLPARRGRLDRHARRGRGPTCGRGARHRGVSRGA